MSGVAGGRLLKPRKQFGAQPRLQRMLSFVPGTYLLSEAVLLVNVGIDLVLVPELVRQQDECVSKRERRVTRVDRVGRAAAPIRVNDDLQGDAMPDDHQSPMLVPPERCRFAVRTDRVARGGLESR